MVSRMVRTWLLAAAILVMGGGLLGAVAGGSARPAGVITGALLGASLAVASGLHLVVKAADGRGAEGTTPESGEDSVERQVWLAASSGACVDAVGVMSLVAVLCAWTADPAVVRWLPLLGLGVVVVDLVVRLVSGWRKRVGSGA